MTLLNSVVHQLGPDHVLVSDAIPEEFYSEPSFFDSLWALRPEERDAFRTPGGRTVLIPRWQAAFGADYGFAGMMLVADPVPELLQPTLGYVRDAVGEPRLNGIVLSFYEGPNHHIGLHSDEDRALFPGSPIVIVSFGEERKLRLRPKPGLGLANPDDFPAPPGSLHVIPWETNRAWKHAVPKSRKYLGRRVSATFRAFERGIVE